MGYWKDTFSDIDGRGSFARIGSVPLVLSVCLVLIYYVCKTTHLPTVQEAVALFIIAGSFYNANQIKAIIAAFKGNFSACDQIDSGAPRERDHDGPRP